MLEIRWIKQKVTGFLVLILPFLFSGVIRDCRAEIVDTGAGISDTVLEFVLASPEVLLVTTPEPSSITDSYSVMKALYKNEKFIKDGTNIHLIANKVQSQQEADAVYEKLNGVVGVAVYDLVLDAPLFHQCQCVNNGKELTDVVGAVHGTKVEYLRSSLQVNSPVFHRAGIAAARGIYSPCVGIDLHVQR